MNEEHRIEIIDAFVVLYKPDFYVSFIVGRNWDKTTYSLWHTGLKGYTNDKELRFDKNLNYQFKNGSLVMDFNHSRKPVKLEREILFFGFTGGTREAMTNWKLLESRVVEFRFIKEPNEKLKESLNRLLEITGVKE